MKPEVRELYNRISHAHEGDVRDREQRYRTIAALVRPGERVVDIGCGDGIFLELLRERGAEPLGVDADPEKAGSARGKGFEVECARAQDLDWSRPVDFVSMIHIVEHLPPGEVLPILLAAFRSLSGAGRLFILTPNIAHPRVQTSFWMDVSHCRPYPGELLGTMLLETGFPRVQWGQMANGLDSWCYGFFREQDRVESRRLPVLNRRARRRALHTGLRVESEARAVNPS